MPTHDFFFDELLRPAPDDSREIDDSGIALHTDNRKNGDVANQDDYQDNNSKYQIFFPTSPIMLVTHVKVTLLPKVYCEHIAAPFTFYQRLLS